MAKDPELYLKDLKVCHRCLVLLVDSEATDPRRPIRVHRPHRPAQEEDFVGPHYDDPTKSVPSATKVSFHMATFWSLPAGSVPEPCKGVEQGFDIGIAASSLQVPWL